MSYKLGTRGSPLSLAQTNWVLDELKKTNSSLTFDIEKITTKGDTDTRPLFEMEQKGIFEKEIDRAVSEKRVDFAVHSMKDVPSALDSSLTIACVPKRESANDILITNEGPINLSDGAPRTWEAIEQQMRSDSVLNSWILPPLED